MTISWTYKEGIYKFMMWGMKQNEMEWNGNSRWTVQCSHERARSYFRRQDFGGTSLQWNLFIMDTLGPAISGSSLMLYRGFPLSEVKCINMVPLGLQNLSLIGRFIVLCP